MKRRTKGASLMEYGLVSGLVAVVAMGAVFSMGSTTAGIFNFAQDSFSPLGGEGEKRDTTPDDFSFASQTGPAGTFTSDPITVSGLEARAAISVVGGEYAINSNPFTSGAGQVASGASVRVRLTATEFGPHQARLTIGGVSATFEALVEPDTTPEDFVFNDATGGGLRTHTSNTITVAGIDAPTPLSVSGGEYAINEGAWSTDPVSVEAGDEVRLRVAAGYEPDVYDVALDIGGASDVYSLTVAPTEPGGIRFEPAAPTGDVAHTFTVPDDVYVVSIIAVGGGAGGYATSSVPDEAGGGGGGLAYIDRLAVVPGDQLQVNIGGGGVGRIDAQAGNGGTSSVTRSAGNAFDFSISAQGGQAAQAVSDPAGGLGGFGGASGLAASAVIARGGAGGGDAGNASEGGSTAGYGADGADGTTSNDASAFLQGQGSDLYCGSPSSRGGTGSGGGAQHLPGPDVDVIDGRIGKVRIFWGDGKSVSQDCAASGNQTVSAL